MTVTEQRETALRLYRLAWRFPEQAPEPHDASCFSDYGLAGYDSYYATAGTFSVEACVFDEFYARAIVQDCDRTSERKLVIEGAPDYVENMLRLIPADMRPHVENTK